MIAILGAGISGLSLGFQLKKQGVDFVIIEKSNDAGGIIQSQIINGFLCEMGPNTVLINNLEIKQMIEDLGLSTSIILPNEQAINNRFILKDGIPEPFPMSLKSAIKSKLFNWNTLLNLLKEPFIPKKKNTEEESLASFCERRLGKQILENFIAPFVNGIYAGDPNKMSIDHTLSILKEAENKYGSIILGMMKILKKKKKEKGDEKLPKQKVFSFKGGLGTLNQALKKELNEHIVYDCSINKFEPKGEDFLLQYSQGEANKDIRVRGIVSCIPAYALADIIQPLDAKLSKLLNKITYAPAVSIHFAINKGKMLFKQSAFGILSRKSEDVPYLGILFNSRFFPHTTMDPQKELITVIIGGSLNLEIINKDDQEIIETITPALKTSLGLEGDPQLLSLKKWEKGIPQYELGHQIIIDAVKQFSENNPGVYINGNFLNGVSVSDCIRNSSILAKTHF